jgi:hypothetical protein
MKDEVQTAYVVTNFDGVASPARQEDLVTSLDRDGDDVAVLVRRARAD